MTQRGVLAALLVAGCAGAVAQPAEPAAAPSNGHVPATPVAVKPDAPGAVAVKPLPTAASAPDPKVVARAQKLLDQGLVLYGRGEYEQAESSLREAVLLYPFLPEANLVLGKVFLIRGSASRDRTMVNSARLMFEMAHALDPELREAAVLLELFQAAPSE